MIEKEEWRPVVGYEGLYEVSNTGQVRSLDKYDSLGVFWIGKLLSKLKVGGYFMVKLRKDGIQKMCLIHRLVAQSFIPNPLNLPQVNHKDEDKTNNMVDNLEWCDAKYNMNYGTINRRRGESLGYGKDNPYSIPIIQYDKNGEFIKEWDSTMDVERELHIQHSNITKCCKKQLHFKTAGGFIWRYKEKAV